MITHLKVNNISCIKDFSLDLPRIYIISSKDSVEDWYNFNDIYNKLLGFKNLSILKAKFVNMPELQKDKDIPSEIEIFTDDFKYILTILEGRVIYESLVKDNKIVALRTDNTEECIISENYFDKKDLDYFFFSKEHSFNCPIIIYIGKNIMKEIYNMIFFEENLEINKYYELKKELDLLDNKFDIDSRKIINEYFFIMGDYKILANYRIRFNNYDFYYNEMGSGIKRFCRLIPYLYISKTFKYTLVCSQLDSCFHPLVSKKIFELFINDNKSQIISRVAYP